MKLHFWLKEITLPDEKGFALLTGGNLNVEKFPLVVSPPATIKLKRIERPAELSPGTFAGRY